MLLIPKAFDIHSIRPLFVDVVWLLKFVELAEWELCSKLLGISQIKIYVMKSILVDVVWLLKYVELAAWELFSKLLGI